MTRCGTTHRPGSAALFLGVVLDEVTITPARPDDGGYTQGRCSYSGAKRSADVLICAVGVADGHGARGPNEEGDEYDLARLLPDAHERERAMDVAARVMAHPQFLRVRNALWRRLQFADGLSKAEIERIARSAAGSPNAISVSR